MLIKYAPSGKSRVTHQLEVSLFTGATSRTADSTKPTVQVEKVYNRLEQQKVTKET